MLFSLLAALPLPAPLLPLQHELERVGVQIIYAQPPRAGVYGLYQSASKKLWVAPITQPLGILSRTFLHEAVHAVQACPSGVPRLLGVKTQLAPVLVRRIQYLLHANYSHGQTAIEREAFEIQGRPDAVQLLIRLIQQRCKVSAKSS